jgi:hypothetical protein
MVLFRQIDESKIEGEGADDRSRLFGREAGQRRLKSDGRLAALLARPAPAMDGKLADAFLEREKRLPFEIDEHLAEQAAEPANIAAERAVDLASCRSTRARWGGGRRRGACRARARHWGRGRGAGG